MGLIDLFQKTRETSMEMKPQEDEAAKVVTCKGCGAELKAYAYGKNLYVCPHCGRYGRLLARTRIRQIADKDSFEELYANLAPADPIHFPGYAEKTAELAEKVGMPDAVKTGVCKIGGVETAIGVMDSHFMMASMGSVVGEKLTRLFEYATEKGLPVVLFTCSGGARMQEGMFSLLQMAKVSAAARRHSDAGLLYITVLTDPTRAVLPHRSPCWAILSSRSRARPSALPAAVLSREPSVRPSRTIFSPRSSCYRTVSVIK